MNESVRKNGGKILTGRHETFSHKILYQC